MYRTNHFRWKMVHVLGIFAHLGLTLTAAISHVYNHSQDKIGRVTTTSDWGYLAAAGVTSPCHFAFLSEAEGSPTPDMTTQTLLVACLVVGSIGLTLNILIFTLLLAMETNNITLTEGEQHWRKQVVTFFGCVLNLLLAGVGAGLAATLGSRWLIAPLFWASVQAPLAFTTAAIDAVKTYREGKDLLD